MHRWHTIRAQNRQGRCSLRRGSERDLKGFESIERVPGDWEIRSSSHQPTRVNARAVRFEIAVAAGGSATLEYEVRVQD